MLTNMPIEIEKLERIMEERILKTTKVSIHDSVARALGIYALTEGQVDEDAFASGKGLRYDEFHQGIIEFSDLIEEAVKWREYEESENPN